MAPAGQSGCVDNVNFPYDPGWSVNSADGAYASIVLGVNELRTLQQQIHVSFEPGAFHEWEFRSADMRTYTLSLDGESAMSGVFVAGLPRAHIGWGDYVWGPTSNVEWDYFRFGVVPEPTSCVSMLLLAMTFIRRLPSAPRSAPPSDATTPRFRASTARPRR